MNASSPPVNPAPPPAPKKSTTGRNLLIGCGALLAILLVCICVAGAFGFYLQYREQQAYAQARAAFEKADCELALTHYNRLIDQATNLNSERLLLAQQERDECQALLEGQKQGQAGKNGEAILAYSSFLASYPSSLLVVAAHEKAHAAFQSAGPGQVASEPGFCDRLEELLERELIPDPQASLEQLYPACGQYYEAQGQFSQAAKAYEAFLAAYPGHKATEAIKAMLAKVLVEAARASGAGEIPAPQVSGSTGAGKTMVIIQNDSPERLRVVFSGPQSRIEELEPCAECQNYVGVGPSECPNLGPVGSYELPPGTYDVVVESGSGSEVTPWTGAWTLADGDEYSSCFFIVTTP
jgi:hypothetical protein